MLTLAQIVLATTLVLFITGLLRLYMLARRGSAGAEQPRKASERKALETIFKQAGAVAAVIAVLYGFLQFSQDERQKVTSEERKQFAESLEKVVSNDPQANLGGIAIVGQLGEVDSIRHWAMVEALTGYVRSAAARPQGKLRKNGSTSDEHYLDPTAKPEAPEQEFDYTTSNTIQPVGGSFIPAQLAISILGTRETKYEEPKSLADVPRARVYLRTNAQENAVQWPEGCSKNAIQEQLEQDWQETNRPESNKELVGEISDVICPDQCPNIPYRQWLDLLSTPEQKYINRPE